LFYKFNFQSTLLNHTWSLAVEEQFYLIWPFLIFYTPRKLELYFLTFIFFVGLISKFYFLNYYTGIGTIKGITFIHFETLGIGALIAYFVHYKNKLVVQALDKHALLLFFSMLTLSVFFTIFKLNQFLLSTFVSFTAAALIVIASSQKQYMFDSILNLKVFNYLGKISYGIYLFHKPIPFFYKFISQKVNFVIDNKLLLFFIYIIITISIAIISWNTIEKFFLKFKHKFDF
jgi:peptidoglycan/LPS O-acetylase OafA/YrhL